jgi:hypothetical protein
MHSGNQSLEKGCVMDQKFSTQKEKTALNFKAVFGVVMTVVMII